MPNGPSSQPAEFRRGIQHAPVRGPDKHDPGRAFSAGIPLVQPVHKRVKIIVILEPDDLRIEPGCSLFRV